VLKLQLPIFDGCFEEFTNPTKPYFNKINLENQAYFSMIIFRIEIVSHKPPDELEEWSEYSWGNKRRKHGLEAQEVYDISKTKYNEGVGSNLEVVEADAAWSESEIITCPRCMIGLIAKVWFRKSTLEYWKFEIEN